MLGMSRCGLEASRTVRQPCAALLPCRSKTGLLFNTNYLMVCYRSDLLMGVFKQTLNQDNQCVHLTEDPGTVQLRVSFEMNSYVNI